ncbi:nitrogenase iron-molybdenum cofactor biosynthesis protein NifN [Aquisphaera insulae]|uniref:nitrogenase iron-molybdenum cofactor biosynthesis protein NifN n=1 Tax=Aquisphaera insulae TaxID=2712864 RepID=UPI0013EBF0C7|nr:nitrogenase iron-molybdenum cofactor biosynthesis protein NifN [Aquisphaera insulae]
MTTTTVRKRTKPLSVSPLKASATVGASLAFMGLDRAVPLMHGAQGCTAFGKVFFVRHFREPIPLQTTAMDQISSVMGADENIIEALKVVCGKHKPSLVGLPTTGLAETQGAHLTGAIRQFRERHPEFDGIPVVPVNTPDYSGCFETGFAAAVTAMIDVLVPPSREDRPPIPGRKGRVNVLAGSSLSVGDVEALKELIEAFELRPIVLPDLADSLDGHLTDEEFNPLTYGGITVKEIATLGDSDATLVVGRSMEKAADLLHERTGVPNYHFDHLMGLEAVDALVYCLHRISDRDVPRKLERHRAQLQDAMVDTHFMIGQTRLAIAADPDLLLAFGQLAAQMGAEVVAAVAPAAGPSLSSVPAAAVQIGDLADLEKAAREGRAECLIGNSHAVDSAGRLGIPIVRAGFPQYDLIGGYQRTFIGYRGTRQLLFDLANMLAERRHHAIPAYRSIYSQKRDDPAPEGLLDAGLVPCPVDAP